MDDGLDEAQAPEAPAQEAGQAGAQDVAGQDWKAALEERDARIAELEGQVAEAARSSEAADALRAEMERLRAEAAEERVGFELRLAGARSVTAAKALLAEHGGDVAALREAEPWLFADGGHQGGTTGLEPAGAAGGDDAELRRWRDIAGLDDKE